MPDYDVIVLGGGSAGTSAASCAVQGGARTLMINDGELGGLCILRGCMPTKALLASAHARHEATHLQPFGLRLRGEVEVDFAAVMKRKSAQVSRFKSAKIANIEKQDYEVLDGRARFAAGDGVSVNGRTLTAKRFVIATGSVPRILPIPGIEEVPVWTSDDVMRLDAQPRALLVQGAGPIALELAQFFARIGTRILLVNRSPLLSHCDPDFGEELTRALSQEENLELAAPGAIESLRRTSNGLRARVRFGENVKEFEADALLMATGRRPALDDLGLERVGLEPTSGGLAHDERMQTANPRVFVAGDATGRYQILHLANQEARVAGHNAAGVEPARTMDYRLKMAVVFTDPPYAEVGMSESEAREQWGNVLVGEARFAETGRAITMSVEHGLWKVFAAPTGCEIVGSAILGPRADDLIHEIALMMRYRASVDDILELPWYHPTLSEVLLSIGRDMARRKCPENRTLDDPW